MNLEKLLELYQGKVLPFVVHLETKERTKLLKTIEKGETSEVLTAWKELLNEKGINSDNVVKDYLTYNNGLNELDEESLKKLKNKNTYFLRKNTDELVEKFNELKVEVVEVVEVKDELFSEEALTSSVLFKGRNKKKKKDAKKNKNAKRKKKNRGKKNK